MAVHTTQYSIINAHYLVIRVDVHYGLETGCHYQAAQTDRRTGRSSGTGAANEPSVWCESVQWDCPDH